MTKKKAFFRIFVIYLLSFCLVYYPIRRSEAFVPAVVPLVALATTSGTSLSAGAISAMAMSLIGIVVIGFNLIDAANNKVDVPLQRVVDVPAPDVPPVTASTGGDVPEYKHQCGQIQSDMTLNDWLPASRLWELANALCHRNDLAGGGILFECVGVTSVTTSRIEWKQRHKLADLVQDFGCDLSVRNAQGRVCPSGYVLGSGNDCFVDNPRKVESDKKCDVLYRNGVFGLAKDLDCPEQASGEKVTPIKRGNKIGVAGKTQTGNTIYWEVIFPDYAEHGYQIIEYEQVGPNQINKTTVTLVEDPVTGESTITNVQTGGSTGVIVIPNDNSVPAELQPGQQETPDNTPHIDTGTGTEPGGEDPDPNKPTEWPTDYAKEGEAGNAADKITNKLDDITKPGTVPDAPAVPSSDGFTNTFFKDTFNNLLQWSPAIAGGVCPKAEMQFDLYGKAFDLKMESHCLILEDNRAELSAAMIVFWLLAALFIVLKA